MKYTLEIPEQIKIEAQILDNILKYKVVEQSDQFSNKLRELGTVEDEGTGLSLKYNKKPAFSSTRRRFYLRGSQPEHNEREPRIEFETNDEATKALNALAKLIEKANPVVFIPDHPGSTTACRMAIITRAQAQRLSLTGKDHYPPTRSWRTAEPHVMECNQHFTEHIGQVVDVLNKAHDPNFRNNADCNVVNEHRVSHAGAKEAYDLICEIFDRAWASENQDCLVALWRIVSGLRAPDVDENGDGRQ